MYLRHFIGACEAFGWSGGPEFKTNIIELANGHERRNGGWAQGRHRYMLPFNNIEPDQYRAVRQMFEVCRGQLHAFLYRDRLDAVAVNEIIAAGDGVTTEFQLVKTSVIDGILYRRIVTAFADEDVIELLVNGAPAGAYVLDRDRGLVRFSTPPGVGLTIAWSGPFAVWVRFANDWLPFAINDRGNEGFFTTGSFDLIEVKPPPPES